MCTTVVKFTVIISDKTIKVGNTMMQFSCSKMIFLGFGPNQIQSNPIHEWIQSMRNSGGTDDQYISYQAQVT